MNENIVCTSLQSYSSWLFTRSVKKLFNGSNERLVLVKKIHNIAESHILLMLNWFLKSDTAFYEKVNIPLLHRSGCHFRSDSVNTTLASNNWSSKSWLKLPKNRQELIATVPALKLCSCLLYSRSNKLIGRRSKIIGACRSSGVTCHVKSRHVLRGVFISNKMWRCPTYSCRS